MTDDPDCTAFVSTSLVARSDGSKPQPPICAALRFRALRKIKVRNLILKPKKKVRHEKCDLKELVKQAQESYVDFQQARSGVVKWCLMIPRIFILGLSAMAIFWQRSAGQLGSDTMTLILPINLPCQLTAHTVRLPRLHHCISVSHFCFESGHESCHDSWDMNSCNHVITVSHYAGE